MAYKNWLLLVVVPGVCVNRKVESPYNCDPFPESLSWERTTCRKVAIGEECHIFSIYFCQWSELGAGLLVTDKDQGHRNKTQRLDAVLRRPIDV